jgi:hypothetical protein
MRARGRVGAIESPSALNHVSWPAPFVYVLAKESERLKKLLFAAA